MRWKLKAIRREENIDQDQGLNRMIATSREEADRGQDLPRKEGKDTGREKSMRIRSTETNVDMISIVRTSIEADMKATVIDLPLFPITTH